MSAQGSNRKANVDRRMYNLQKQSLGETVLPLLVLFLSRKHKDESEDMSCATLSCSKFKLSLLK